MADQTDPAIARTICEVLGAVPGWDFSEEFGHVFTDDVVPVWRGRIGDTPDRGVGVRLYDGGDDPINDERFRLVQLRFRGRRGDPDVADELASTALPVMEAVSRVGGISGIRRNSFGPLGADNNGREERTDDYIIILDTPEASS